MKDFKKDIAKLRKELLDTGVYIFKCSKCPRYMMLCSDKCQFCESKNMYFEPHAR